MEHNQVTCLFLVLHYARFSLLHMARITFDLIVTLVEMTVYILKQYVWYNPFRWKAHSEHEFVGLVLSCLSHNISSRVE